MKNLRKVRFLVLAGLVALVFGAMVTSSADAGCGGYGGNYYRSYYAPVNYCYKPYVPSYNCYQYAYPSCYGYAYPNCYNTYYTPTYYANPSCYGGLYW